MLLVFDWGGTFVKYACWSENKGLHQQNAFSTPSSWEAMKKAMMQVFEDVSIDEKLEGIAISSPGSVDTEKGIIGGISAIEYIHHFPIQQELEELFAVPVSIENDANSAALAELWQGAAKDIDDALFVVIGTGIGGAVIQNRKLLKGRNLFAGEFGIMELGEEGSFSMLATAVHMAERYCLRKGLDEKHYSGKQVFEFAEKGDRLAQEEVNKFYDYLSLGIYNLLFTTDPQAVILGGGVSQKEDLVENIQVRIDQRLEKQNLQNYRYELRTCHFHNDANLLGAVYRFLVDRKGSLDGNFEIKSEL